MVNIHPRRFFILLPVAIAVIGAGWHTVSAQRPPLEDSAAAQTDGAGASEIPLELVDLSGLSPDEVSRILDRLILTSAQAELGASSHAESDALAHPVMGAPFRTVLTGADIIDAHADFDSSTGSHYVDVELNDAGADAMVVFTESHIGEALGIVVYGRLVSAPIIRTRLSKRFVIEGGFSEEEARELAARLNNVSAVPQREFAEPRVPLLLPIDFSLIVNSISAILLLVVILLL